MIQFLFEFTLVSLVILGLITQVILPLLRNSPLFPLLRKDLKQAEEKLHEAHAEVEVKQIEKKTEDLLKPFKTTGKRK